MTDDVHVMVCRMCLLGAPAVPSTKRRCADCGCQVWVSTQMAPVAEARDAELVCEGCARARMLAEPGSFAMDDIPAAQRAELAQRFGITDADAEGARYLRWLGRPRE